MHELHQDVDELSDRLGGEKLRRVLPFRVQIVLAFVDLKIEIEHPLGGDERLQVLRRPEECRSQEVASLQGQHRVEEWIATWGHLWVDQRGQIAEREILVSQRGPRDL